jgi:hypothetical protein
MWRCDHGLQLVAGIRHYSKRKRAPCEAIGEHGSLASIGLGRRRRRWTNEVPVRISYSLKPATHEPFTLPFLPPAALSPATIAARVSAAAVVRYNHAVDRLDREACSEPHAMRHMLAVLLFELRELPPHLGSPLSDLRLVLREAGTSSSGSPSSASVGVGAAAVPASARIT